jgi:hypothetical protein
MGEARAFAARVEDAEEREMLERDLVSLEASGGRGV